MLQYTGEFWDKAGLSIETVKQHVKAQIQPLLDALVNADDGEHFKQTSTKVPDVDVRAKGGWFYQLVYGTKDFGMDWCRITRLGVTPAEANALSTHYGKQVFSLEVVWDDAVAIYSKYASNIKGEAGKKEWKTLAAIVAGRTHGAVQIIDKINWPILWVKFQQAHDLLALELDPVTGIVLMLSTGAYGLVMVSGRRGFARRTEGGWSRSARRASCASSRMV